MPSAVGTISSCACEPGVGGEVEAVADLDALDRLDAHQRAGQPRVEPAVPVHVRAEARRQAVHDHLDDAAEGVAVLVGLVDLGDHRLAGVGVEAAHRVGVERVHVGRGRDRAGRGLGGADRDDVRDHLDAERLLQERRATAPSATRAAVSRAVARSRIGRASSKSYFCMPTRSAWPGRGRVSGGVAGQRLELGLVDRVGGHHLLPLGPLGVADPDRDRAAEGAAVPHPAEELDLVLLELHPGAAAVAEAASRERVDDVLRRDLDVGGQTFEDGDQGRAVGLAGSEPTQHAGQSVTERSRLRQPYHAPTAGPASTPTTAPTSMNGPNG